MKNKNGKEKITKDLKTKLPTIMIIFMHDQGRHKEGTGGSARPSPEKKKGPVCDKLLPNASF